MSRHSRRRCEVHPVGQDEVLAHGQPQEELGLLEGAGETASGACLRDWRR